MRKHPERYLMMIVFAFLFMSAYAQKKGYSRGYVVHLQGDTIEGWVKDRSSGTFLDVYPQIRFKPENAFSEKNTDLKRSSLTMPMHKTMSPFP
jgi:hypothetical protein